MSLKTDPKDMELLNAIYSETHRAAALVSGAWSTDGFTRAEGTEMLNCLRAATAAMEALHCRLRGLPHPKIGDKP